MSTATLGAYRVLLQLYPRRFRDEYGTDMALLFAEQLRDEPTGRVLVRGLVDLAITVPNRHLEAHMNRTPTPLVPMLFAALGVAGLCVAVIGGTAPVMLTIGLVTATIAGILAAGSWRHVRPLASDQHLTTHWWKFLALGTTVLAAVALVTTATGEVPGSMWLPLMAVIVSALALLGTGLVLGLAHLVTRQPRNAHT